MKIFIAGARSVKTLPPIVEKKMYSIYQRGFDILVGDCYGVDTSVQKFYAGLNYKNIIVYASNGKARNNIGNWNIRNVPVENNIRGFDFYKQKDNAMADDADYGFMIWDGESRGTLNNMIHLVMSNKDVLVYLCNRGKLIVLRGIESLDDLVDSCGYKAKNTYKELCQDLFDRKK